MIALSMRIAQHLRATLGIGTLPRRAWAPAQLQVRIISHERRRELIGDHPRDARRGRCARRAAPASRPAAGDPAGSVREEALRPAAPAGAKLGDGSAAGPSCRGLPPPAAPGSRQALTAACAARCRRGRDEAACVRRSSSGELAAISLQRLDQLAEPRQGGLHREACAEVAVRDAAGHEHSSRRTAAARAVAGDSHGDAATARSASRPTTARRAPASSVGAPRVLITPSDDAHCATDADRGLADAARVAGMVVGLLVCAAFDQDVEQARPRSRPAWKPTSAMPGRPGRRTA